MRWKWIITLSTAIRRPKMKMASLILKCSARWTATGCSPICSSLIAGEEVQLPHFDFRLGRSLPGDIVHLEKDQIIILEGIHGLNPDLLPGLSTDQTFRIYVSCLTQLNLDRYNRISTTDTPPDPPHRARCARARISGPGDDPALGIGAPRRKTAYLPIPGKCRCDVQLGAGLRTGGAELDGRAAAAPGAVWHARIYRSQAPAGISWNGSCRWILT